MPVVNFALAVFAIAIIVIFSQDFKKVFKKLFAFKSAQILLPLVAASILVYGFEDWFVWTIYYFLTFLNTGIAFLTQRLPFPRVAQALSQIIVLTLISVLPVLVLNYIVSKKSYLPFQYPYLTSTIIWIVSAMLLIVT